MTYGDSSIAILLLHHELSHRLTNDVGTSKDDALLTTGLDVIALQQGNDAQRRCRNEARQTNRHTAHVDGMETVDILTIVDGLDNLLLVDVLGQGELNDKAIDIVVVVQFVDTSQQLGLCDVVLKTNQCALEATSLASQNLIFNIRL